MVSSNKEHSPKWLKPYRTLLAHRPKRLKIKQSQCCPMKPSWAQVFLPLPSLSLSTLAGSSVQQLQAAWSHTPKSRYNKASLFQQPTSRLAHKSHWTDLGHYLFLRQSLARQVELYEELRTVRKSYRPREHNCCLASKEGRAQGGWLGHRQCLPRLELSGGISAEK